MGIQRSQLGIQGPQVGFQRPQVTMVENGKNTDKIIMASSYQQPKGYEGPSIKPWLEMVRKLKESRDAHDARFVMQSLELKG